MNIKIKYLKKSEKFKAACWVNEKKLDTYMLPSFTKKIVKYLERN
jgi:A/G-specific adenine glycosylase